MTDNIIAVSTLVGESAINIIRLSGDDVIKIVNKYFSRDLEKFESNTINYGKFIYENEIIDEVLVSIFKAPKSYTTENIVEINCHGGVTATNKIMEILLLDDVRQAEPGEFIKRALLNGRIDWVESEAVGDLISSSTESARKLSINGINGEISKLINSLRKDIMKIIGNIEVNIDYPEYEDVEVITIKMLKEKMKDIKEKFMNLYKNSEKTNIIKNGINISIIGRPNVGKSSLLNKLTGEEKAIVTDIEGTTRDIVEGKINLDGIILNLIDTAGIRKTEDKVEKIGVDKSYETLEKSDLILLVLSNSNELNLEEKKIIEKNSKKVIVVVNKNDLPQKIKFDELNKRNINYVKISIKNNEGIEELLNLIKEKFDIDNINNSDFTYLSNSRQISLLKKSINIIKEIEKSIQKNVPIDLIEVDIRNLWDTLGEITGETYKDELLDEIFSNFCLGK